MMYTGKPLVTNKGAVEKQLDPRQMFIYGNLATARAQAQEEDGDGLVPSSWELVRRRPGGHTETIAKKVLTFDLTADGNALCSDGASVVLVDPHGRTERLLKGEMIDQVLAL